MSLEFDAELRALAGYVRKWSYESRADWEREQLRKLQKIPFLGNELFRFAKRKLRRWKGI